MSLLKSEVLSFLRTRRELEDFRNQLGPIVKRVASKNGIILGQTVVQSDIELIGVVDVAQDVDKVKRRTPGQIRSRVQGPIEACKRVDALPGNHIPWEGITHNRAWLGGIRPCAQRIVHGPKSRKISREA